MSVNVVKAQCYDSCQTKHRCRRNTDRIILLIITSLVDTHTCTFVPVLFFLPFMSDEGLQSQTRHSGSGCRLCRALWCFLLQRDGADAHQAAATCCPPTPSATRFTGVVSAREAALNRAFDELQLLSKTSRQEVLDRTACVSYPHICIIKVRLKHFTFLLTALCCLEAIRKDTLMFPQRRNSIVTAARINKLHSK